MLLNNISAQDEFDCATFLANAGLGRRIVELQPKEAFFSQGDRADTVFFLQKGRAKITVISESGKEAIVTLLSTGDFVGEESLAFIPGLRLATASAVNKCTALTTVGDCAIQVNVTVLICTWNAAALQSPYIPPITQESLAEMIGTTRSRVSFFMNRFRVLGYISYNGRIQVHKALLNVVLLDQLPEHNARTPDMPGVEEISNPAAFQHPRSASASAQGKKLAATKHLQ